MGVIAAEYRCCLAVSNDLRDGVQAVLGRVQKNQRKWERLSAKGKNGKEKPLLHGLLASM